MTADAKYKALIQFRDSLLTIRTAGLMDIETTNAAWHHVMERATAMTVANCVYECTITKIGLQKCQP